MNNNDLKWKDALVKLILDLAVKIPIIMAGLTLIFLSFTNVLTNTNHWPWSLITGIFLTVVGLIDKWLNRIFNYFKGRKNDNQNKNKTTKEKNQTIKEKNKEVVTLK